MPQKLQEWLEQEGISKKTVSEIDISYKEIEENNLIIDGSEFPKLEKLISLNGKNKFKKITLHNLNLKQLELWGCQIGEIEIINCPNLTYFDARNNLLNELSFLDGLEKQLIHLDISDNDLKSWLSFLGKFKKLEFLFIGNRFNGNIISIMKRMRKDCLRGSLEKLISLSQLKEIDISNTDIDSGLEYLSESTEKIGCSCFFKRRKCFAIKKQLKDYSLNDEKLSGEWYNLSSWRKYQNCQQNQYNLQTTIQENNQNRSLELEINQEQITDNQLQENDTQIINNITNNTISFTIGDNSILGNISVDGNEINYQNTEDLREEYQQITQIIQTNLPNWQNK